MVFAAGALKTSLENGQTGLRGFKLEGYVGTYSSERTTECLLLGLGLLSTVFIRAVFFKVL